MVMKTELDLESYPTLHLHLMIDDYHELIAKKEAEERTLAKDDLNIDRPSVPALGEYATENIS